MKFTISLLLIGCSAAFGQSESRDFLTSNEVDQVREAQDPNDRLLLYIHFARQRIDLMEQALSKEKPGRAALVHNSLEDYSKIIEAIDSVSDDALRRKVNIDKGMVAVAGAEKDMLEKLDKVDKDQPKDLERFKFVLQEAIDATSDSRELTLEDSAKRSSDLTASDAKEKKERESSMSSAEVKERKKAAAAGKDEEKKVPSLYRSGEKPKDPQ